MRVRGATGAALVVLMILTAAACGSTASHGASPATSPPPTKPRSAPAPTTTRPPTSTTHPADPVADDHLAQFVLTTSLTAAKSIYDRSYDFTTVTPQSLAPLVPNVKFVPLEQANATSVGLLAQDRHDVFFVDRSASGRWYCITDNDTDGVSYGSGASLANVDSNGECQLPAWP